MPIGNTSCKRLRLFNRGHGVLTVWDVATDPPFRTWFTSAFTIPAFGFVDLFVEFVPTQAGAFATELEIDSDDPRPEEVRVRLLGSAGSGSERDGRVGSVSKKRKTGGEGR